MSPGPLPRERDAAIRAPGARGGSSPSDLASTAAHIRRTLLGSAPAAHRPDLATLIAASRTLPAAAQPRVRARVGVVAVLVAAGTVAAAMAGVLPSPLQDTVHDGAEIVGVHLPPGDEMREVDIIDVPTGTPLWDDGHHGDAPADGHSHEL